VTLPAVTADYERWRCPHTVWAALADFATAAVHRDGIDSVSHLGVTLDLYLDRDPLDVRDQPVLPVFFTGSVPNRDAVSPPFFSGRTLSRQIGVSAIYLADPTVSSFGTLGLAWYDGSERSRTRAAITALLQAISERSAKELLLVGGSGGGFAALRYAGSLTVPVSVFTWNPQTNWLRYEDATVRTYLAAAFPSIEVSAEPVDAQVDRIEAQLAAIGASASLLTGRPRAASRVLYLQNATDWYVAAHAMPYVAHHRLELSVPGRYCAGPEHVVCSTRPSAAGRDHHRACR